MKKWVLAILLLMTMSALLGGIYLYEDESVVGDHLDSHKGVPVFYNGLVYVNSHGKHYNEDGYYYGQKWQCVEFVKRFYYDALGHEMPEVYGHAKDFFDPNLPHKAFNKRRGLVQYRNGEDVKPEVDDLLVFRDYSKYGHVAIVTKVTSDSVEVIQQNIFGKPRETFDMIVKDGHYIIGSNKKPIGWLRKK
jgi:surface antigen